MDSQSVELKTSHTNLSQVLFWKLVMCAILSDKVKNTGYVHFNVTCAPETFFWFFSLPMY